MHYLPIIFGFAMTAAAIDIHLEFATGCSTSGGGGTCTNINPTVCCYIQSRSVQSIRFAAIPTSWSLELRGYAGGGCNTVIRRDNVQGITDRCMSTGPVAYTGAGYSFRSKKREVQEDSCSLAPESCASAQKADMLFLADGQKYNIVNMDEGLLTELVGLAINGTTVVDIPKEFKEFEISA